MPFGDINEADGHKEAQNVGKAARSGDYLPDDERNKDEDDPEDNGSSAGMKLAGDITNDLIGVHEIPPLEKNGREKSISRIKARL
ncbi:MAG TPA: hypothetical protein VLH94_01170 [Spirochaetia bacterium]|nr:hypothetical protein [Spirochaetia bacterium]